jgi:hypothetical protein
MVHTLNFVLPGNYVFLVRFIFGRSKYLGKKEMNLTSGYKSNQGVLFIYGSFFKIYPSINTQQN